MIGGERDIEEMCYAPAMAILELDLSPEVKLGEALPEFLAVLTTVFGTCPITYL